MMSIVRRVPRWVLVGGSVVGVVALAAAWWAFRPELLFVDERVSEAFPAASTPMSGAVAPQGEAAPSGAGGAKVLASGRFKGYAHDTEGTATIYEVDGKRVLRLSEFMTSNGPDVRVTLVAASDAKDDASVKRAGYVDLGVMKGNVGDQNYEVPGDLDLSKYRAVTIWCERFSVNFGTAALSRA